MNRDLGILTIVSNINLSLPERAQVKENAIDLGQFHSRRIYAVDPEGIGVPSEASPFGS